MSTVLIEPTNNAAEQALRPAVIWRRTSFGSQSASGSQFVVRLDLIFLLFSLYPLERLPLNTPSILNEKLFLRQAASIREKVQIERRSQVTDRKAFQKRSNAKH